MNSKQKRKEKIYTSTHNAFQHIKHRERERDERKMKSEWDLRAVCSLLIVFINVVWIYSFMNRI